MERAPWSSMPTSDSERTDSTSLSTSSSSSSGFCFDASRALVGRAPAVREPRDTGMVLRSKGAPMRNTLVRISVGPSASVVMLQLWFCPSYCSDIAAPAPGPAAAAAAAATSPVLIPCALGLARSSCTASLVMPLGAGRRLTCAPRLLGRRGAATPVTASLIDAARLLLRSPPAEPPRSAPLAPRSALCRPIPLELPLRRLMSNGGRGQAGLGALRGRPRNCALSATLAEPSGS
mmetsp:Transcript_100799/g.260486  ORF Transcript_100799/g.260486 Transcript_100799/m.260486 type:complete len:234 (-) Transcript_100799:9-710(-)